MNELAEIKKKYFPPLSPFHYITYLTLKPGPPIVAAITVMLDHNSLRYGTMVLITDEPFLTWD